MRQTYIQLVAELKHVALANAIAKTIKEFPKGTPIWVIYIAMHPAGISFEVFSDIAYRL